MDGEWKDCFLLEKVNLQGSNYLGFSAATGDVAGFFYFKKKCQN